MKIAHIVSTFPPYKAGIGNTAYQLSWELSSMGHDVTVLTRYYKGRTDLDDSLPFKVRRLRPWLKYGNASFVPQLYWSLGKYDVIHLHYPFFGGAEIVYFRDLLKSLPLIVHYHMDVVGEGVMKRMFSWHSHYIMPRIIHHARKVIVTSEDYAEQSHLKSLLRKYPNKFKVIPLGVNSHIFKPRRKNKQLLIKHRLEDKKVVLFVGALDKSHYFKGINYLIKAFQLIASNDDYRLLIVGKGNLKTSYESIVKNFGLERKVIFTGFVSDDVLPLYYNLADVFVLSSIDSSEAFGIAALEAMASGVPVIASDLPGVRSVVARREAGILVKPRQVDSLAQQIDMLLKNPQIRNRYSELARKRIEKYYTWESVTKQVDKLYRSEFS